MIMMPTGGVGELCPEDNYVEDGVGEVVGRTSLVDVVRGPDECCELESRGMLKSKGGI